MTYLSKKDRDDYDKSILKEAIAILRRKERQGKRRKVHDTATVAAIAVLARHAR